MYISTMSQQGKDPAIAISQNKPDVFHTLGEFHLMVTDDYRLLLSIHLTLAELDTLIYEATAARSTLLDERWSNGPTSLEDLGLVHDAFPTEA